MRSKQLGAAPGDHSDPGAGRKLGWFGRLRAQPGFRTAAVAFLLTVVLGIGSTVAYAYWSQSSSVNIVGKTGYRLPAVVGKAKCVPIALDANRVEWTPVVGAETDAVYVVRFSRENGKQAIVAVPQNAWIHPYDQSVVHGALGSTGGFVVSVNVSVNTALLKTKPKGIVKIQESDILHESEDNDELTIRYSALGQAWTAAYPCG